MRGELSARDVPEGCHLVFPGCAPDSHGRQNPPEASTGPFGAAATVRRGGVRKATPINHGSPRSVILFSLPCMWVRAWLPTVHGGIFF